MTIGKNVVSFFDGMSCGQIALNRAGVSVNKYYAYEIDKYAMKVANKNYPKTIQMGSVTEFDINKLPKIDLFIGGSPCQGFSFAGKQLNFSDPRSKLFFDYVDALNQIKKINPDVKFLLENVRMKKEYQDIISNYLGVEPIMINSALVSAQNRVRLYWTNIPGIEQPEDRNIYLKDIIENGEADRDKSLCVTTRVAGATAKRYLEKKQHQMILKDNTLAKIPVIKQKGELIYKPHKSQCLDANYFKGADNHGQRTGCIEVGHAELNGHDFLKRVYSAKGKSPTLTAVCGGNQERKIAIDSKHWRKLTPIECERLQTLPDDYTAGVSNSQRYKMLGNGWTIDVISHIFKNIGQKPIKTNHIKQLEMQL